MVAGGSADFDAYAASKRSKAKTSQSSSKSRKSSSRKGKKGGKNSRKNKKNSKNSGGSDKKNSSKKSSSRHASTSKRKTSTRRWTSHKEAPAESASSDSLTLHINNAVLSGIPSNLNPGGLRVNRVIPNDRNKTLEVRLNDNFTYLPVTNDFINDLTAKVRKSLPDSLDGYRPELRVGNKALSYYISRIDKLPAQYRKNIPFVREANPDFQAAKGMQGDNTAMAAITRMEDGRGSVRCCSRHWRIFIPWAMCFPISFLWSRMPEVMSCSRVKETLIPTR